LPPDQENGKEAMEMRRIALAAAAVLMAASGVAGSTLAAADWWDFGGDCAKL
jgi:hypothetical protein